MRIIVMCGAGASSTFVATRLQRAAKRAGIALTASADSLLPPPRDLATADAVLLGAHATSSLEDVRALAQQNGVPVGVLPADAASDRDGVRTLEFVQALITGSAPAVPTP